MASNGSRPRDAGPAPGPLTGVRVVECASMLLGPVSTQYLGDLGADVIKVEPPEGDLTRAIGPRRNEGMGAFYLSCNRNKRSIVLDLKSADGQAALQRLVEGSDVLVHSVRTPAAKRLGLTYEQLSPHNSRLIHCHVKGFSDGGPYGGKPAYDDVIQAASGVAMLQTVVTGQPRYVPSIIADKVGAVHSALAVLAALFHRERTGSGQAVTLGMFETMVAFNMLEHQWGHMFDPPEGGMGYDPIYHAVRHPYGTQAGYVAFLPYSDAQWRRFFELIGRPEIMSDPRFATFPARQKHFKEVWAEIERQLALRTREEWIELLADEDIPFAPVNHIEELPADPHLAAVGFWKLAEHPSEGTIRLPSSPLGLCASPASIRRLPPRLGEHTDEILGELEAHGTAGRHQGR